MSEDLFKLTLEDRLFRTRYEPDSDHPHIKVNEQICSKCEEQLCVLLCPASVYRVDPNNPARITVSHDNCLECGTCLMVCDLGSIEWHFPDGGLGVKYRIG